MLLGGCSLPSDSCLSHCAPGRGFPRATYDAQSGQPQRRENSPRNSFSPAPFAHGTCGQPWGTPAQKRLPAGAICTSYQLFQACCNPPRSLPPPSPVRHATHRLCHIRGTRPFTPSATVRRSPHPTPLMRGISFSKKRINLLKIMQRNGMIAPGFFSQQMNFIA